MQHDHRRGGPHPRGRQFHQVLAIALLATTLTLTSSGIAAGDPGAALAPGQAVPGRLVPMPVPPPGQASGTASTVLPRASGRLASHVTPFSITFHGMNAAQQAAFRAGVERWSRLVVSNVTIRVDVTWKSLDPNLQGLGGPAYLLRDTPNAPKAGLYYPDALADARAGRDLQPGHADIVVVVNADREWYLGTTGHPPSNRLDLPSAAMHWVGNGLGFAGLYESDGTHGYRGPTGHELSGYDALLTTSTGKALSSFADGSTALGTALASPMRFTGAAAVTAYGKPVPIYGLRQLPPPVSAYSLDDAAFPPGNPNTLMRAWLLDGEAVYDPGEVGLAVLRSIGWTTAGPPTPPAAPPTPTANVGNGKVTVTWTAPADTGRAPVDDYIVTVHLGASATPVRTIRITETARSTTITGLTNGTAYRIGVAAHNALGTGTPGFTPTVKPRDLLPFADATAFVTWQWTLIMGGAPPSASLANWRNQINAGTATPGDVVAAFTRGATYAKTVAPVVRLYEAFFQRAPDESGLAYWSGRLAAGRPLADAASAFAASAEFEHRYGALANAAFVDLVYQNVLGRPGDSGGRAYWTAQLDHGRTRGSVMIGFSESGEFGRRLQPVVDLVAIHHALLRVVPGASALAALTARLAGGTTIGTIANELLVSAPYLHAFGIDPPSAMVAPHLIPGDREVTVRITAPTTHGAPIDSYVVTPTRDGTPLTPVTVAGTTRFTSLTGLDPTASYTVTVAPRSIFGQGPTSSASNAEVPAARFAPGGEADNPRHDSQAHGTMAASPEVRWTKSFRAPVLTTIVREGTVFADMEGVFGETVGTVLYAFDADSGALRWAPTRVPANERWGTMVYEDHRIFTIAGNMVAARSAATGAVIWAKTFSDTMTQGIVASRGVLYITGAADGGALVALDEADGSQLWRVNVIASIDVPAVMGDLLYTSTECGEALALNRLTGATVWRKTFPCGTTTPRWPAVATDDGVLTPWQAPGAARRDPATGTVLSSFTPAGMPTILGSLRIDGDSATLRASSLTTNAAVWSVPATALDFTLAMGDQVIAVDKDGLVTGHAVADGATTWSAATGLSISDGPGLAGQDGHVVLTTGTELAAIS